MQWNKIIIILSAVLSIALTLFFIKKNNTSYQTIQHPSTDKAGIIERALKVDLPIALSIDSQETKAVSDEAMKKVYEGNYEQAIDITLKGLERFPSDFTLQSDLAALLGDCSEITPSPLKERMVEKAKHLFDKLLKEADRQPKEAYYPFKNEYYYRFKKYKEQYELGLKRVADYWGTAEWNSVGFKGYYSQGVGAANYARQLMQEGNKAQALHYAQKAVVAWAQYFSYKNDYYNALVHYSLALGILGFKDEMMRALEHSASLIKKDLDYFEFKEVITFVNSLD